MARKVCKFLLLVVFTLVLLGSRGLSAGTPYQDEYTEDFTFPAGGAFGLINVSGTVKISGWDEERVCIEAVKLTTRAENRRQAEKMLDRVVIEVRKEEGKVEVTTKYPKGKKLLFFGSEDDSCGSILGKLSKAWDTLMDALSGDLELGFGIGIPVEVNYEIKLPRSTSLEVININGDTEIGHLDDDLEVNLVSGDLRIVGLGGDIEANLVNGNIRIVRAAGSIRTNVVNGTIDVELSAFETSRGAELHAINGDITIRLEESARADLDLSTISGDIELEMPVEVEGKFVRKMVKGRLNGGGPAIEVHAVNGDIRLKKM